MRDAPRPGSVALTPLRNAPVDIDRSVFIQNLRRAICSRIASLAGDENVAPPDSLGVLVRMVFWNSALGRRANQSARGGADTGSSKGGEGGTGRENRTDCRNGKAGKAAFLFAMKLISSRENPLFCKASKARCASKRFGSGEDLTNRMAATKRASKKSASKNTSKGKQKVETVMHEFKHHELRSGRSGKKVTNPKQAIAIGLSEARAAGAKIPKKGAVKKSSRKSSSSKRTRA